MTVRLLLIGLMAALACLLWPDSHAHAVGRLLRRVQRPQSAAPPNAGVLATVAAVRAGVHGGSTLLHAFEGQAGRPFATPVLGFERIRRVLALRACDDDTPGQIERAAVELEAACQLSERMGCGAVRCLDAVEGAYRRELLNERARRRALSVPLATVRLLSALPALTVLLGEALGARPISFLVGSVPGAGCLTAGIVCYAAGAWWMRMLLDRSGLIPVDPLKHVERVGRR